MLHETIKRILGDRNNTIAGRAIKAHRENVINRAKQLTLN